MRLIFESNVLNLLLLTGTVSGFSNYNGYAFAPRTTSLVHSSRQRQHLRNRHLPNKLGPICATLEDTEAETEPTVTPPKEEENKKPKKSLFIKNERDTIARKKDYLRGAGVFGKVKKEVAASMRVQFDSELMNKLKESPNYMLEKEGLEIFLAKDHGFCWGVERSINLAYSAVETFPDANLHITNELIHNPMVNDKLHAKNVNFIEKDENNVKDFSQLKEGDVVMLPAFGATLDEMKELDSKDVKVVDTTCPWVAKVWNTVHTHQVRGLTSVIHGKYAHEETMATKSMCETYICVNNVAETEYIADFILNAEEGDGRAEELIERFSKACSAHFDPHKHLKKIGLANQTTMYKKETRAIGQLLQKVMMKKFGPDLINEHYYEFDTICDATQVRQDAVDELCNMHFDPKEANLDFILVVGGFDSSNTAHLLEIPQNRGVNSYHINEASCIDANNTIRHRMIDGSVEEGDKLLTEDMLWTTADDGTKSLKKLRVGVTSGASTPDKEVHDALGQIMMLYKVLTAEDTVSV